MRELLRLMIVDDEPAICEGMMRYDWSMLGFQAVASATSARLALERMAQEPVDLVISDIKMPGMSGLELCEIIKERYPDCQRVLLTGYKDFEYVRRALTSGVADYLLKPVDFAKNEELFERLYQRISIAKAEQKSREKDQKRLAYTLPAAATQYMRALIEGDVTLWNVEEQLNWLEIPLGGQWFGCAAVYGASASLCELLSEAVEAEQLGYVLYNRPFTWVLMNFDAKPDDREAALHKKWNNVALKMSRLLGDAAVLIVVSGLYTHWRALPDAARQALQSSAVIPDRAGMHLCYAHDAQSKQSCVCYPYETEQQLLSAISDGNEEIALPLCRHFAVQLAQYAREGGHDDSTALAAQFLAVLDRAVRSEELSLNTLGYNAPYDDFKRACRSNGMACELCEAIKQVSRAVQAVLSAHSSSDNVMQRSKAYIDANYASKLSLQDVANVAYMNASYFSVQFKHTFGVNFMDYLRRVRIDNAVLLLHRPSLRIYQISEMVGYQNQRYFTEAFRKERNCLPAEYRRKLGCGE